MTAINLSMWMWAFLASSLTPIYCQPHIFLPHWHPDLCLFLCLSQQLSWQLSNQGRGQEVRHFQCTSYWRTNFSHSAMTELQQALSLCCWQLPCFSTAALPSIFTCRADWQKILLQPALCYSVRDTDVGQQNAQRHSSPTDTSKLEIVLLSNSRNCLPDRSVSVWAIVQLIKQKHSSLLRVFSVS